MVKVYTLRPEYEEDLVGGTIVTGVEAHALDIKTTLDANNGQIVTSDGVLQSILENYYGARGLVFDAKEVEEGKVQLSELKDGQEETLQVAPSAPSPSGETVPGQTANAVPPAQHGDESDYSTFHVEQLKDVLSERGIEVPNRATKAELVEALEKDDEERSASSGS